MDRMSNEMMQDIILGTSGHKRREYVVSFMEAVAWRLGLPHNGHPDREAGKDAICPVLAHHARFLNNILPDDYLEAMKEYIDPIASSKNKEKEQARQRVFVLSAARIFAAMVADNDGLCILADRLRSIPDTASFEQIRTEAESVAKAANGYATDYAAAYAAEMARFGHSSGFSAAYWAETVKCVLVAVENRDEVFTAALETFKAALEL